MATDTTVELVKIGEVQLRREEFYACGCTTTRVETRRVPKTRLKHCDGHHGDLVRLVLTTEYKGEPS